MKIVEIPVVDGFGEIIRKHHFNLIDGKLLVPVKQADLFGIDKHQLNRLFNKGHLLRRFENGVVKRDASSKTVYFDLNAWKEIDFNEKTKKPRKTAKTVVIN